VRGCVATPRIGECRTRQSLTSPLQSRCTLRSLVTFLSPDRPRNHRHIPALTASHREAFCGGRSLKRLREGVLRIERIARRQTVRRGRMDRIVPRQTAAAILLRVHLRSASRTRCKRSPALLHLNDSSQTLRIRHLQVGTNRRRGPFERELASCKCLARRSDLAINVRESRFHK